MYFAIRALVVAVLLIGAQIANAQTCELRGVNMSENGVERTILVNGELVVAVRKICNGQPVAEVCRTWTGSWRLEGSATGGLACFVENASNDQPAVWQLDALARAPYPASYYYGPSYVGVWPAIVVGYALPCILEPRFFCPRFHYRVYPEYAPYYRERVITRAPRYEPRVIIQSPRHHEGGGTHREFRHDGGYQRQAPQHQHHNHPNHQQHR